MCGEGGAWKTEPSDLQGLEHSRNLPMVRRQEAKAVPAQGLTLLL